MTRNLVITMFMMIGMAGASGCTQNQKSNVRQQGVAMVSTNQSVEPIGSVKMLADGTLILILRAETGSAIGHAEFRYQKDDPKYAEIMRHIGGLNPGEEKIVLPFPEKK